MCVAEYARYSDDLWAKVALVYIYIFICVLSIYIYIYLLITLMMYKAWAALKDLHNLFSAQLYILIMLMPFPVECYTGCGFCVIYLIWQKYTLDIIC